MGNTWQEMSMDQKKYWMIETCLHDLIHSGELGIKEVIESKGNKIAESIGTLKADLDLISKGRSIINKVIETEDMETLDRLKEELS